MNEDVVKYNHKTGIVIVTYNCLVMIQATLAHLRKKTPNLDQHRIIVVDNNSEDGTREFLENYGKGIVLILNSENKGYGLANRQGVNCAIDLKCQRILLLNPDTMPQPGWFEALHEVMDNKKYEGKDGKIYPCGIVGAKLLDWTDPDRIIHGGTHWDYSKGTHLTGMKSANHHNEDKIMHWVTGAVMLITVNCWLECGGIPPFYFYGQDSMLCFMAWHNGYSVWYSSKCEVIHYEGYSMRQADKRVPVWKKQKQEEENKEFKKLFEKYYKNEY